MPFIFLLIILIISNKYEFKQVRGDFIRISYKGDYAIKALIDIGIFEKKGAVTLKEISQREDIPLKFLEQIFIILKKKGYLISKRGKDGGYRLAILPSNITIGKILRDIEGSLKPITCFKIENNSEYNSDEYNFCEFSYCCAMQKLWKKVYIATMEILDSTTLEDLIIETEKMRGEYQNYQI